MINDAMTADKVVLEADALGAGFGKSCILDGLSLSSQPGKLVGLIGPNGAGKSTLMRILAGLAKPTSGTVTLGGQDILKMPASERARILAFMPQEHHVHWPICVYDIIAMGRMPFQRPFASLDQKSKDIIAEILETLSLTQLKERSAFTLSGGELARVLLARALAQTPQILLVDEPTAGLDPAHKLYLLQHLSRMSKRGMSILMVLHDLSLAARFCDHLILLDQGKVYQNGVPKDVLTPEILDSVYHIKANIGEVEGIPVITALDCSLKQY